MGGEPKKAPKAAELNDANIAKRTELERDIACLPEGSFGRELCQAQLDALPKPEEVTADPQDAPPTPQEAEDTAAKLTIARNDRLAAFKGRKDAHQVLVDDLKSQRDKIDGYIQQADAANDTAMADEAVQLVSLNARISFYEKQAETCPTKLAYGFHPEAMNSALTSTFGHLEGKPLVMEDLTLALNNFLLTSQLSTEIFKQQEQLLNLTTGPVRGSIGSADVNPQHLKTEADQAFTERRLAEQGGVNQEVPPAVAATPTGPQNAAAIAAGVQAALAGNPLDDHMDVKRNGPKRGADELSNYQDKEGDAVLN